MIVHLIFCQNSTRANFQYFETKNYSVNAFLEVFIFVDFQVIMLAHTQEEAPKKGDHVLPLILDKRKRNNFSNC